MADTWDITNDYGNPDYWTNFGLDLPQLAKIGGYTAPTDYNFWNVAKNLLSGTSSMGQAGQLAGIAGIYGLLNSLGGGLGQTGQGIYKGYQGGIPNYTASRTMTPAPITVTNPNMGTTTPRRPGSGGVTYFSPMTYTPVGKAAGGGISALGGYSDGGRLLRGPGDGVSDSIPATIGEHQPAKLADGEFVIPARIVSEIGNGSTEAGARKLYEMMDRVQGARKKSLDNVAANTKADKYLPT